MINRLGVVMAGGTGSRLVPTTSYVNKHFIPIYDKPLIYYPTSILMLNGIRDIAIVCDEHDSFMHAKFCKHLRNLGVNAYLIEQNGPNGIGEVKRLTENINYSKMLLILGDNIFWGASLIAKIEAGLKNKKNCVFTQEVKNPQQFGVLYRSKEGLPLAIMEKPNNPTSNEAVTGMYCYNKSDLEEISIYKSERGELEISDINTELLKCSRLDAINLGRGTAWLDAGTTDDLLEAQNFVRTIQVRQGNKIANIEEIARQKNFIDEKKYSELVTNCKNNYFK